MERINICGIPHEIYYSEDSFNADRNFGMIVYTEAKITVNKNMPEELKTATICHEVVHAMLVHMGENALNDDEGFVTRLATAINQSFYPKISDVAVVGKMPSTVESE